MLSLTETTILNSAVFDEPYRSPATKTPFHEKSFKNRLSLPNMSATTSTDNAPRSNLSAALKRRSIELPTGPPNYKNSSVTSYTSCSNASNSRPQTPTKTTEITANKQRRQRRTSSSSSSSQDSAPGCGNHSNPSPSTYQATVSPVPIPNRSSSGDSPLSTSVDSLDNLPPSMYQATIPNRPPSEGDSSTSTSADSLNIPITTHSNSGRKTSLSLNLFKPSFPKSESPTPAFTITDKPVHCTPLPSPNSSLSVPSKLEKSGNVSENSDFSEEEIDYDELRDDDELFTSDSLRSVPLMPFGNQVGGHTSLFQFSKKAVCKPLVPRENQFYETIETQHPELLPFVPQYLGVLNVTCRSQDVDCMPEVVFEQNKHLLPKWILNKVEKENRGYVETPNQDQKGDDGYSGSLHGSTRVNKKLQEQVLQEVFSTRALRKRIRQVRALQKEPSVKRRHSMISIASLKEPETITSDLSRSYSDANIDKGKKPQKHRSISYSENKLEKPGAELVTDENDDGSSASSAEPEADNTDCNENVGVSSSPAKRQGDLTTPRPQVFVTSPDNSETAPVFKVNEVSSSLLAPEDGKKSHISAPTENPWSLHCYTTQLLKLNSNNSNAEKLQKFILLEDLTGGLKHPCVLDLKMGTRQHGIDATYEKRKSQMKKCGKTTSKSLGVRICGMQVYKVSNHEYLFQDKYYGRNLTPQTFRNALSSFLHNDCRILAHIPIIVCKLRRLAKIIRKLDGYRFYASSLLLIYDGDENPREIDIRIIDFAHCTTGHDYPPEEVRYPPAHEGFDIGYLLGLKNLCRCFEAIYKDVSGVPLENLEEEEEGVFEGIGEPYQDMYWDPGYLERKECSE